MQGVQRSGIIVRYDDKSKGHRMKVLCSANDADVFLSKWLMVKGSRLIQITDASYYWGSYGVRLQVSVLHPKIAIFVPGFTLFFLR